MCIRILFFVYNSVKSYPDIELSELYKDGSPSVIYDADGNVVQNIYATYKDNLYAEYEDISENAIKAFIAYLDPNYFEDQEFDFMALSEKFYNGTTNADEAMVENYGTKRSITQRLLNNQMFYIKTDNSNTQVIKRNLKAILWAVQLKKENNKNNVLEVYLNTLNFGDHTIGISEAAERYFDKGPGELTIAESALLVVLSLDAEKYSPINAPQEAEEMQRIVLRSMLVEGMITEKEYQDALGEDVISKISENVYKTQVIAQDAGYGYNKALLSTLRKDLMNKLNFTQTEAYNAIYRGGLKIYSCQEIELQKLCENVANNDSYYPRDTKFYIRYSLRAVDSFGNVTEYSESDLAEYVKNTLRDGDGTSFSSKKEAKEIVKKFEKFIIKNKKTIEESYFSFTKEPQSSMVLIDQGSGKVKALVGGRDMLSGVAADDSTNTLEISDNNINRAMDYTRNPGTAFSILSSYLPALDACGHTVADVVDDCVDVVEDENVMFAGHVYGGMTNMRKGILDNNDVVAEGFFNEIDEKTSYEYLKNFGITTLVKTEKDADGNIITDLTDNLALGNLVNGVSNYELTSAYSAIANRGVYNSPILYSKVTDSLGRGFIIKNSTKKTILKEENAWLMTDILRDSLKRGSSKAAALDMDGMHAAGQKGATYNKTDNWFVGYTPYFTLGVWMGNDNGTEIADSQYTEKMWAKVMKDVVTNEGKRRGSFKKPSNITTRMVCSKSGKRGCSGVCDSPDINSDIYMEYFIKGTEPESFCNSHIRYAIDKETGLPATDKTKEENIVYEVFMIKDKSKARDKVDKTLDAEYLVQSIK
ncbi:MAG: transglycosylase domain-containing protein [Lachnospiraceae bacterium]|nr:transglycosylase domain-containing protein [Lachnospiraceae bacterium]